MLDSEIEYVVLEITSHGLDQHRVSGVNLVGGVYTNITPEHLDYHKTYEEYLFAKAKMMKLIRTGFVVINRDDESYEKLSTIAGSAGLKILKYGVDRKSDYWFDNLVTKDGGSEFDLLTQKSKTKCYLPIPGDFNVYNFFGALSASAMFGIDVEKVSTMMDNFGSIKGRWNVIQKKPFKVIVDFAHTPNALRKVLTAARKVTEKNLIVVFGCAGLRDKSKREQMGKIAGEIADITIVTSEDPRVERLSDINDKIEKGWRSVGSKNKQFYRFDNKEENIKTRSDAIKKAIELAKPGDTIIITGKGHEMSLCFGNTEYPWNDIKETKKLLK
jgi:UDP-N-acetylmuramoyl-L-alanyl-D-glutamate--2,6-diaminopimelate ligase